MTDVEDQNPQGEQPAVLGRIPTGPADTTLEESAPPPRIPRRRQRESSSTERMPKGAWLRVRASGGMVFRSSEIVVFEDGRLTYRASPTAVYGQTLLARELTDGQLQELRAAVGNLSFANEGARGPHRGRDTIAYEFEVRDGQTIKSLEAFQGVMGDDVAGVVHQLSELVRVNADEIRP